MFALEDEDAHSNAHRASSKTYLAHLLSTKAWNVNHVSHSVNLLIIVYTESNFYSHERSNYFLAFDFGLQPYWFYIIPFQP